MCQDYMRLKESSLREAKREINRDLREYVPKKAVWGFVISILLTFSINALSSADFQSAIFDFSLGKMYELNSLGTVCIWLIIPMSIYWLFAYLEPTILLRRVLDVMNNEFDE